MVHILLGNHLYFYEVQRSGRFPWSRYLGETMAPSIMGRTSASICLADTMMPVVHTSSSCLFFSAILKPSPFCIRLHQVHIPSRQSSSLSPHRSILTVSLGLFHHVNIRRLGSYRLWRRSSQHSPANLTSRRHSSHSRYCMTLRIKFCISMTCCDGA